MYIHMYRLRFRYCARFHISDVRIHNSDEQMAPKQHRHQKNIDIDRTLLHQYECGLRKSERPERTIVNSPPLSPKVGPGSWPGICNS